MGGQNLRCPGERVAKNMPCLVSVLVLDSAECELAGTAKLSLDLFFSPFQTLNSVTSQFLFGKNLGRHDKQKGIHIFGSGIYRTSILLLIYNVLYNTFLEMLFVLQIYNHLYRMIRVT